MAFRDGSARQPILSSDNAGPVQPVLRSQESGVSLQDGHNQLHAHNVRLHAASVPSPGFAGLFRYAAPKDRLVIGLGIFCSMVQGCVGPAISFWMKDLFESIFWPNDNGTVPPVKAEHSSRDEKIAHSCEVFFLLSITTFLTTFVGQVCLGHVGDMMVLEIKKAFFDQLLRKDVGWYDSHSAAEMATRLSNDTFEFREGVGQKFAQFVSGIVMIPAGFAIAFYQDWRLTLMLLGVIPILAITLAVTMKQLRSNASRQQESYAKAGGVAETTVSSIRTVAAFDGYECELAKYNNLLAVAEREGTKTGWFTGLTLGFTSFVMYSIFGLGFYLGSLLVVSDLRKECWLEQPGPPFGNCFTGATLLSTLFAVLYGGLGVATAGPYFSLIIAAKAAAARLYSIIDEPPAFDADIGDVLDFIRGEVVFRDVVFHYPTRPDVAALNEVSFKLNAGSTTAFAGPSGSGKSTIVSLLQRFYDPQAGSVCLDGHNIKSLNLTWLRSKMALVQQEPVLFSGTIQDNIAYGLPGSSTEDVQTAARSSNAHGFISGFPLQYKTEVGERGLQMSGGQKQRIAIARAVVRDPSILLLDEATSALDNESERIVQKTLDDLLKQKARTTLVIAHRLSTVMDANQILVLENGRLLEAGTHKELMAKPGSLYAQLWELQALTGIENPSELLRHSSQSSSDGEGGSPHNLLRHASTNCSQELATGSTAPRRSLTGGIDSSSENVAIAEDGNGHAPAKDVPVEDDGATPVPVARLWELHKGELGLVILALLSTVPVAVCRPLMGFLFGNTSNLYSQPPAKLDISVWPPVWRQNLGEDELMASAHTQCLEFTILGTVMMVSTIGQYGGFRQSAEAFTRRLRYMTFKAMMRQEMAWFDAHPSGQLADRLATEVPLIKSFTGESLAAVIQLVVTVGTGLGIALWYSWQLTLTSALFLPPITVGTTLSLRALKNTNSAKAAPVVSEAMGNIKTVAAFSLQTELQKLHEDILLAENREELRKSYGSGFASAWTGGIQYVMFAGVIFVANIFISQAWIHPNDVLQVLFPILFSASGAAIASQWQGDKIKAQTAVSHIFHTIDRTPTIDAYAEDGEKLDKVTGIIEFRHVAFNYPTRPDLVVFSDFDLKIEPKTTVALVGPSGSGKSTAISLLQRFYSAEKGSVCLDGYDIRSLNLSWLRAQMAFVQQEPVLFNGTILDNIAYGRNGASKAQCVAAAKASNADGFIMSFPLGYGTEVGDRGGQLSGGQKQRIAIARSIVRDPAVLLLDEATSALDSESERIVQEALDKLLTESDRTTLVVAHRLSTIMNANAICVIYQGMIVEKGTHAELMKIPNGHYVQLAARQEAS